MNVAQYNEISELVRNCNTGNLNALLQNKNYRDILGHGICEVMQGLGDTYKRHMMLAQLNFLYNSIDDSSIQMEIYNTVKAFCKTGIVEVSELSAYEQNELIEFLKCKDMKYNIIRSNLVWGD